MARNYAREYRTYHSKPKQKKRRAARGRSRYKLEKAGKVSKGDGKDVHHKDRNPSNTSKKNLKVSSKRGNRSYSRKKEKGHGKRYKG